MLFIWEFNFGVYWTVGVQKSLLRQEFLSKVSTFVQKMNLNQICSKDELQKYFCKIEICDRALITLVVEVTIKVFRRCSGLIGLGIDWKVFEKTFHISRLPGGAKLFKNFLYKQLFNEFLIQTIIRKISFKNRDRINVDLESTILLLIFGLDFKLSHF